MGVGAGIETAAAGRAGTLGCVSDNEAGGAGLLAGSDSAGLPSGLPAVALDGVDLAATAGALGAGLAAALSVVGLVGFVAAAAFLAPAALVGAAVAARRGAA
jgi:hypothetical protein